MNRRRFLRGLLAAAALAPARPVHAGGLAFGPASFDVTATSALVWLKALARAQVRVEYATSASLAGAAVTAPMTAGAATDFTAVVELKGLVPDTEYFYRGVASAEGTEAVPGPIGRFRTAPTSPRDFRLAWSGDMEAGHQPFALLDHVTALRPDLFVMVGDTMYADVPKHQFSPTLAHYRAKHRENREDAPLRRLLAAMPVVAIWDDHEVRNDFDRTYPARAEGLRAFREYWPVRSPDTLYRRLGWSPAVDLLVLDCRSYRTPHTEADGPSKTMLGAEQKAWLKDALATSRATFKLVVSSVPFLPPGRPDSWAGFGHERRELIEFIQRERVRNVVVLSADFHMALDYEEHGLQQFLAGPIGAWPFCRGGGLRRQILEQSGRFFICDGPSFGMLTVRPEASPPQLEVQFVDAQGAVRHRRTVLAS